MNRTNYKNVVPETVVVRFAENPINIHISGDISHQTSIPHGNVITSVNLYGVGGYDNSVSLDMEFNERVQGLHYVSRCSQDSNHTLGFPVEFFTFPDHQVEILSAELHLTSQSTVSSSNLTVGRTFRVDSLNESIVATLLDDLFNLIKCGEPPQHLDVGNPRLQVSEIYEPEFKIVVKLSVAVAYQETAINHWKRWTFRRSFLRRLVDGSDS